MSRGETSLGLGCLFVLYLAIIYFCFQFSWKVGFIALGISIVLLAIVMGIAYIVIEIQTKYETKYNAIIDPLFAKYPYAVNEFRRLKSDLSLRKLAVEIKKVNLELRNKELEELYLERFEQKSDNVRFIKDFCVSRNIPERATKIAIQSCMDKKLGDDFEKFIVKEKERIITELRENYPLGVYEFYESRKNTQDSDMVDNYSLIVELHEVVEKAYKISEDYPYSFLTRGDNILYKSYKEKLAIVEKEEEIKEFFISTGSSLWKHKVEGYDVPLKRLQARVCKFERKYDIPFFALYNYYPMNLENFKHTSKEFSICHDIWDFKANSKVCKDEFNLKLKHELVCKKITPIVINCLRDFLGDDTSLLTFLLVPASNAATYKIRYSWFAPYVCKELNMADAYPYVKYIEDGEAKHLGGGKSARYIFDSDFFRGKIVVLFDDVITTGRTLMDVKVVLESLGAIVLCAVTLGVTRHRRRAYNQIEMIKYYKNNILL